MKHHMSVFTLGTLNSFNNAISGVWPLDYLGQCYKINDRFNQRGYVVHMILENLSLNYIYGAS